MRLPDPLLDDPDDLDDGLHDDPDDDPDDGLDDPDDPLPGAGPLPAAHWTVLILRDVLHWSAADAAALLGMSRAELGAALGSARRAVLHGRAPEPAERAALSRLVGRGDHRLVSLTGALLREHAPPAPRSA